METVLLFVGVKTYYRVSTHDEVVHAALPAILAHIFHIEGVALTIKDDIACINAAL